MLERQIQARSDFFLILLWLWPQSYRAYKTNSICFLQHKFFALERKHCIFQEFFRQKTTRPKTRKYIKIPRCWVWRIMLPL